MSSTQAPGEASAERSSISATSVAGALAPFAAAGGVAWVSALIGEAISWPQYAASVGLVMASLVFGVAMSIRGSIRTGTVIGSIGFLAAVGLLRNAAGGSGSGITMVSLLAVFQTALYLRRRSDLAVVLMALAALYLVPILIVGPPEYPHSGYRSAVLAVCVNSIIGLVTQGLVEDIRRRASRSHRRERMLVEVNDRVQSLFDSPDARADICQAARQISGATAALIYEPGVDGGELVCTGTTVEDPSAPLGTPAARGSAVYEAFNSGKPLLITEIGVDHVGVPASWRASGSPSSALYQPLLKDETPLAVLVVSWHDLTDINDPRAIVASLLAHEGAAVISRADVIEHLTDEARTDPLTGLPNRRAWDARLSRAVAESQPMAVAMIDLDHFKEFNDAHGHPEGDRLLRDTADAWRSETRTMDFLARLGGEEFGLLIPSADAPAAYATVERLRMQVPRDQTCSAGVAIRESGETVAELINRADSALYEAKSGGRNQTRVSSDAIGAGDAETGDERRLTPRPTV